MKKLKQSDIKEYRIQMLKDQGGKCAFCGEDCVKPCLDHSHREPHKDKVRAVICNWCNIAIGKLENSRLRTGTSWEAFKQSFASVYWYIWNDYSMSDWHPSKRKSELIAFKKLSSDDQYNVLIRMHPNQGGEYDLGKNATQRIALFRKLNSKT